MGRNPGMLRTLDGRGQNEGVGILLSHAARRMPAGMRLAAWEVTMSLSLDNRVAVVTGAGRGLGRAVAIGLAQMGAKVVVNDLGVSLQGTGGEPGPADEVVAQIKAHGGKAVANYQTVADFDSAREIIGTAISHFGKIDILVNNAGNVAGAPIWELDPETFSNVVGVHLFGTFNCTRHACVFMKDQGYGRIVNIVSRGGLWGSAGAAPYGAGKGGIFGFTNVVSKDLKPFGITVNGVNPSAMLTRMVTMGAERAREMGRDTSRMDKMMAEAQEPENVAALVQYLCSDEAGWVTGQYFLIEKGSVGWFQPLTVTKSSHKEGRWTPEELAAVLPKFDIPPLPTRYGETS